MIDSPSEAGIPLQALAARTILRHSGVQSTAVSIGHVAAVISAEPWEIEVSQDRSQEDRLRDLERQMDAVREQTQVRRAVADVELFVRKLERKVAAEGGDTTTAGVSTLSSLCTSACFSSASTIAPRLSQVVANDPEVAGAFATLHRRGIEVLGEEGLMDAIIEQAAATPATRIALVP
jgi:hypothetical protein